MTATTLRATEPQRSLGHRLLREVPLLIVLYLTYQLGRVIAGDHATAAFLHAEQIWDIERWLHLPDEGALQRWVWSWPGAIRAANAYYAAAHFPVTAAVLVWIFVWRSRAYPWFRWSLVALTGLGLIGHLLYPLAPPRMLTNHGLLDTGVLFGQSVYSPPGTGLANQYAAMPSLHVGWAALVAIALVVTLRTRWRWLALVHPILTMLVVVVTANHYWLDGLVGLFLLTLALVMVRRYLPAAVAPTEAEMASLPPARPEPAGSDLVSHAVSHTVA